MKITAHTQQDMSGKYRPSVDISNCVKTCFLQMVLRTFNTLRFTTTDIIR